MESKSGGKIDNVVLMNVETSDYPDFSNASIESADIDGVPMTELQLEKLNKVHDFIHEEVLNQLF